MKKLLTLLLFVCALANCQDTLQIGKSKNLLVIINLSDPLEEVKRPSLDEMNVFYHPSDSTIKLYNMYLNKHFKWNEFKKADGTIPTSPDNATDYIINLFSNNTEGEI